MAQVESRRTRTILRSPKRKRPTENGWALDFGGAEATGFETTLQTPE